MSGAPRSSFYWAMRLLPKAKRQAMFAIYGFCRTADDIADGDQPWQVRQARLTTLRATLTAWRETGVALDPAIAALAPAARAFCLPLEELDLLLDGMQADILAPPIAPPLEELSHYCRQVAGTVGVLAIHVMGRPDARSFALALAEALQFTNVLRDVAEDARRGRLYLPRPCLEAAGMAGQGPLAALTHPGLRRACEHMLRLTEERFDLARAELERIGRRGLWPALAMMATYQAQLRCLRGHDWRQPAPRPASWRCLGLALAAAIAGR